LENQERDPLTAAIIGGALEVHKALGPGLLESVYEECLAIELMNRGLVVARQVPVPLQYKGRNLDVAYRMDLLVNDLVIVEVKAISELLPVHEAQMMTYLRLAKKRVGLLLNFHTAYLKNGIIRLVL
jgi:GxxExxY protein